jgi:hypothetical protein
MIATRSLSTLLLAMCTVPHHLMYILLLWIKCKSSAEIVLFCALQKSQDAQSEKNRAVVATLNAEVRRSKSALQAEIPKLEKLAAKKVSEGIGLIFYLFIY